MTTAQVQVAFRLESTLIARIDRHAERLASSVPGLVFSRSDAVRALLSEALRMVEGTEALKVKDGDASQQTTLDAAYRAHSERFVKGPPEAKPRKTSKEKTR